MISRFLVLAFFILFVAPALACRVQPMDGRKIFFEDVPNVDAPIIAFVEIGTATNDGLGTAKVEKVVAGQLIKSWLPITFDVATACGVGVRVGERGYIAGQLEPNGALRLMMWKPSDEDWRRVR
jgi:hypothetical protein